MAIGRTFQESLQKALRGLETGMDGLDEIFDLSAGNARGTLTKELRISRPERLWHVADGFRAGLTLEDLFDLTAIDP
jgi:carbamoyl-phosphate synthase large subunit